MQRGKKRSRIRLSKDNAADQSAWKYALIGLGLAWAATFAGLLGTAGMIYWEWIGAELIPAAAKGIMIISMLIGGIYVFKKTRGKERIWILIMLIAYLAIRFLMSLILTFL